MCFFVNNQYRILYTPDSASSIEESLDEVFGRNLLRIGSVLALLDSFEAPTYLSRIWTIFEQYTAIKLGVPVRMILPPEAAQKLVVEIHAGKPGILRVKDALCRVDSRNAVASVMADELKVKKLISESVGFETVDAQIRAFMVAWVGTEVQT